MRRLATFPKGECNCWDEVPAEAANVAACFNTAEIRHAGQWRVRGCFWQKGARAPLDIALSLPKASCFWPSSQPFSRTGPRFGWGGICETVVGPVWGTKQQSRKQVTP